VLIAVGDLARAAQVLALHASRGGARLFLARLIQRPDHQPAPPATEPRRFSQPGDREPADHAHRRERIPHRPVQQPLRPIRRPVSGMLGDRPAIALRQPADQRTYILARLQPRLRPGETRPQRNQQFPALPRAQARPYPGSRSRLRFCCPHKLHDREAAAPGQQPGISSSQNYPQLKALMAAALLAAGRDLCQ
jgi:hypothetical protein